MLKICPTCGMATARPSGYCEGDEAKAAEAVSARRARHAGKKKGRWSHLSKRIRERRPICEECQRRHPDAPEKWNASEQTHHMVHGVERPERYDRSHPFWDAERLEALCRRCHAARHLT